MEFIQFLMQYYYVPMSLALYFMHIKLVKIDSLISHYNEDREITRKDIAEIKRDLHYLVKIREEEFKK